MQQSRPLIKEEEIKEALRNFEQHLRDEGMKEATTIKDRMRGAREFASFLIGKPHHYGERMKDKLWAFGSFAILRILTNLSTGFWGT